MHVVNYIFPATLCCHLLTIAKDHELSIRPELTDCLIVKSNESISDSCKTACNAGIIAYQKHYQKLQKQPGLLKWRFLLTTVPGDQSCWQSEVVAGECTIASLLCASKLDLH